MHPEYCRLQVGSCIQCIAGEMWIVASTVMQNTGEKLHPERCRTQLGSWLQSNAEKRWKFASRIMRSTGGNLHTSKFSSTGK